MLKIRTHRYELHANRDLRAVNSRPHRRRKDRRSPIRWEALFDWIKGGRL